MCVTGPVRASGHRVPSARAGVSAAGTVLIRSTAAARAGSAGRQHHSGPGPSRPWWRQPIWALAAVAVAHGMAPIVLLGPHWGFGIDETIYLSQLNAHVPAGLFSAPRARGTTFVAAPVTELTSSVTVVRFWLAALSAVGLFLAYRPWLRIRGGYVVPVGALLFTSVWPVVYYGFEAMPNEWVAFAVLAATGHVIAFLRDGRTRHLVWIVLAMALTALFRPSDAGFATAGLVIACIVIEAPRRLRLLAAAAAVAGTLLGVAEWVIEAFTSFGGPAARVHAAQAEQGGGGLHFSGLAQARSLAGPLLCRAGCHADAPVIFRLWWALGAALIVAAVVRARHRLRQGPELAVVLVALATAAQYVLTVGYAAPRFLIPAYALLALPCAYALVGLLARARRGRTRTVLAGALLAVLLAHLAVQVDVVLVHVKPPVARFDHRMRADAAALHALGVRRRCIVLGQPGDNEALAYAAGCSNVPTRAASVRRLRALGRDVVWLGPTPPPARYGSGWRRVVLPWPGAGTAQVAYVALASRSG